MLLRRYLPFLIAYLASSACWAPIALAQEAVEQSAQDAAPPPMILGVASSFSQGSRESVWQGLKDFPLRHFRAGLRWSEIERREGQFRFRRSRHLYPDRLAQQGGELVLTLNFGNPLYDNGHTPYSPEAVAAFGRFAAAMVERFPAITTVEIGNEFNGNNFVNGPVRDAGLAERGRYHLAMLRSASEALRAIRPDIEILGGAVHSIPAGYLWPILEAGGDQWMDGLAIHPYTTPIDQLPAQIGVLRRHPRAATMPIWVTEWGSEDAHRAPHELIKGYVTMAALGFRALYWYPLTDRGDGLVPLLDDSGRPTATGDAFAFVQRAMIGQSVTRLGSDPFTHIYAVGEDMLVLWGESREVILRGDAVRAWDTRGNLRERARLALSRDAPLILHREGGIDQARDIGLGCHTLIADTRDQFSFPPDLVRSGAAFEPSVTIDGASRAFATLPGQQRGGVPWTPYLGLAASPRLRLTARSMIPAGRSGRPATITHRYLSPKTSTVELEITLSVSERSNDGVKLVVRRNDQIAHESSDTESVSYSNKMELEQGDILAISVNSNKDTRGDNVRYHYRLRSIDACDL